MATIIIPFRREMRIACLEGRKCCTTRTKRYGNPGDTFTVRRDSLGAIRPPGQEFKILDVIEMPYGCIAIWFYRIEGFESEQDFRAYVRALFSRRHRKPPEDSRMMYLHFFIPTEGVIEG